MNCLSHGKGRGLWGVQGTVSGRELDVSGRQGGRPQNRAGIGSPGEGKLNPQGEWHAETRTLEGTGLPVTAEKAKWQGRLSGAKLLSTTQTRQDAEREVSTGSSVWSRQRPCDIFPGEAEQRMTVGWRVRSEDWGSETWADPSRLPAGGGPGRREGSSDLGPGGLAGPSGACGLGGGARGGGVQLPVSLCESRVAGTVSRFRRVRPLCQVGGSAEGDRRPEGPRPEGSGGVGRLRGAHAGAAPLANKTTEQPAAFRFLIDDD